MSATLVIMAAGMGSRFGGLKQLEPIGPNGEILLDLSIYDAQRSGFDKVVFIIREENEADFRKYVGKIIENRIDVEYVYQDCSNLPAGRTKPFGTGHAVLCCRDKVTTPFAAINADDYYGTNAFSQLSQHLACAKAGEYAMVGYSLKNTVTENGTVSRGVCEVRDGFLCAITEHTKITSDFTDTLANGSVVRLDADAIVSMNLWGFTTDFFDTLGADFEKFMSSADLQKDEFFLPFVVNDMIKSGAASARVLHCPDNWYGMTYREDLPTVKAAIKALFDSGAYSGI